MTNTEILLLEKGLDFKPIQNINQKKPENLPENVRNELTLEHIKTPVFSRKSTRKPSMRYPNVEVF